MSNKRVRADMDEEVGRQIMLRSAGAVDAIPEYSMIELNGTIHTLWDGMPVGAQTDDTRLLQDQELGDFSMMMGKPQLVVGSHKLIGKVEKFREPVAIMRKRRRAAADADADVAVTGRRSLSTLVDADGPDGTAQEETHYEIVGVVREKYVFKARPKPVLNKWNKKVSEKTARDAVTAQDKATRKEARLEEKKRTDAEAEQSGAARPAVV